MPFPTPPFFPGSTSFPNSLPPPPERLREMENGGCNQFITHCLCRSFLLWRRTPDTLLLLQRGDPPTGDSPPWTATAWVLPTGCSSSQTALAWIPPWGAVLQEQTAPEQTGPLWPIGSQFLPANLLWHGLSSLHGSTGAARSLLQHGLPTGS